MPRGSMAVGSLDNEILKTKMTSNDRILRLVPEMGKRIEETTGMLDSAIFTGKNNLHAYLAPNNMWTLRYEHGQPPEGIRNLGSFTNFNALIKELEKYLDKRSIKIQEVIDVW